LKIVTVRGQLVVPTLTVNLGGFEHFSNKFSYNN